MTDRRPAPERKHEISWGVRVHKDPTDMTRAEIEDALFDVAEFATRQLVELRALRNIINQQMGTRP